MGFSSYWKEIAVVLAALFAIVGAISDVRDKRTGNITSWGRIFFLLTILSMIGGFWAQWKDNAKEEADSLAAQKKTRDAQTAMLTIIQNTQKSVHELSRLLQPIGQPEVTVLLMPNCLNITIQKFCAQAAKAGEALATNKHTPNLASVRVDNVDWSDWPDLKPGSPFLGSLSIGFFHDPDTAKKYLDAHCSPKCPQPDLFLNTPVSVKSDAAQTATLFVLYYVGTKTIIFVVDLPKVTPWTKDDNIMSMVDIPSSTVIITDITGNDMLQDLWVRDVFMRTTRGQTLDIDDLAPQQTASLGRVFIEHFLPAGSP